MGPYHAMQVAERLYMQGFLSYPRTESTGYPKDFDMLGLLQLQTHNRYWGAYVRSLLEREGGVQSAAQGEGYGRSSTNHADAERDRE